MSLRKLKSHLILNSILLIYKIYFFLPHLISKFRGTHYFEDYLRVYPDNIAFYAFGLKRKANKRDIKNFLNHLKFYKFASQFVKYKVDTRLLHNTHSWVIVAINE